MEEQNSWKGHTFTLMIFGGIVVLCAIFFVLGMLVGRMQGLKMATITAEAASKPPATEAAVIREEPSALRLPEPVAKPDAVAKPDPPPRVIAKTEPPSSTPPTPASAVALQVGAWKNQGEAEKQVRELKKKGFARAFILSPVPSDRSPLYRVQVAVADKVEADAVKQRLEKAGFKAIIKK